MEGGTWLAELEAALTQMRPAPALAGDDGSARDVGPVGGDERAALLDLARIAAHTSERWAAPISTYLAGLAMADVDPAARAELLRELVERLE